MIAEVQEAGRKQSVSDEAARKAQWSQDSSLINNSNGPYGGWQPAGRTQTTVIEDTPNAGEKGMLQGAAK